MSLQADELFLALILNLAWKGIPSWVTVLPPKLDLQADSSSTGGGLTSQQPDVNQYAQNRALIFFFTEQCLPN